MGLKKSILLASLALTFSMGSFADNPTGGTAADPSTKINIKSILEALGTTFNSVEVYYENTEDNARMLDEVGLEAKVGLIDVCNGEVNFDCERKDQHLNMLAVNVDVSLIKGRDAEETKKKLNNLTLALVSWKNRNGFYGDFIKVGYATNSASKFKNYEVPVLLNGTVGQNLHIDIVDGVLRLIVQGEVSLGVKYKDVEHKINGKTYSLTGDGSSDGVTPFYVNGQVKGGLDFFKGAVQLNGFAKGEATPYSTETVRGAEGKVNIWRDESGRSFYLKLNYSKGINKYELMGHEDAGGPDNKATVRESYWQAGASIGGQF